MSEQDIVDDIEDLYKSLDRMNWSIWESNFISDMYERVIIDGQRLLSEKQSQKIISLREKMAGTA